MKNIELLDLTPAQKQLLLDRCAAHARYSSIDFKVLEAKAGTVVVRITQDKNHAGVYFDNKRLSEIGKELFNGIEGWNVVTRPIPYKPHPTDVVTAKWIDEKIIQKGIKVKDLGIELGIDPASISAYRRGLKPLSGPVKAAFFYYFKILK